jgi:hypothetical protein
MQSPVTSHQSLLQLAVRLATYRSCRGTDIHHNSTKRTRETIAILVACLLSSVLWTSLWPINVVLAARSWCTISQAARTSNDSDAQDQAWCMSGSLGCLPWLAAACNPLFPSSWQKRGVVLMEVAVSICAVITWYSSWCPKSGFAD